MGDYKLQLGGWEYIIKPFSPLRMLTGIILGVFLHALSIAFAAEQMLHHYYFQQIIHNRSSATF